MEVNLNDQALPGVPHGHVVLVDWSHQWADLYTREAASLRAALGPLAVAIEHYGSTSVPELRAKPILDILVGGTQITDAVPYLKALAPLGYEYARSAGVPDHLVFGRGLDRTHLVHVVLFEGPAWQRALRFRDTLRADPTLRAEYGALKERLAGQYQSHRARYTEEKAAFVERVIGPESSRSATDHPS
jgi:GrpB-like predicted nucleotidyltransferase (UPF0157 family)